MAKRTPTSTNQPQPETTIATHIAVLAEQIDRIVQMKPGLQTKAFKAIKQSLMKPLE